MVTPPRAAKQFNKVAVRLAGRRFVPVWALVRHRGRRSGREYVTPVAVMSTSLGFLIGLPWGRDTDWVRNIQAAGDCRIRWKGREYRCSAPRFVERDAAIGLTRGWTRRIVSRADFAGGFLELTAEELGADG